MKTALAGLCVFFSLALVLIGSASASETLTNDAVIAMVKAGLGEELIIMKIRTSPTNFDLSTSNILQLKQEGVSEAVLMAMMGAAGQRQGAPAESPQAPWAQVPGQETRLYGEMFRLQGGQLQKMEYTTVSIAGSMGQAFMNALLFVPTRKAALIAKGKHSPFTSSDNSPVFYTRRNPVNVFGMVKLTVDAEKNIRYVNIYSRVGTSTWEPAKEDAVEFTASRETNGLYKMTPTTRLAPGEYAIVTAKGTDRIYEFCIDTPTQPSQ